MPPAIRRISAQYLNAPEEVAVARQSTTSATIRQRYLQVGHQWKFEALSRILETEEHDGVIAFVRTRAGTEELAQKLTRAGAPAIGVRLRVDEQGEVLARSNVILDGYWERPDETGAALRDGWFHTGDGGSIDVMRLDAGSLVLMEVTHG